MLDLISENKKKGGGVINKQGQMFDRPTFLFNLGTSRGEGL